MNTKHLGGRCALVTGAASGIGRATALAVARRGGDLVICDVDEQGLASVREEAEKLGRRVLARRVDVSDRQAMAAFADAVHAEIPAVDLLVNNAGVAIGGYFAETSLEEWDWLLGINLWGVIYGCHFFVPKMIERQEGGHVVNIASLASLVAAPGMSLYNTSKFAVRGLSESMRSELALHGIGVTAVCPGVIDTAIVSKMRLSGSADTDENRRRAVDLFRRRGYAPERVAEALLGAVQRDRAVIPVSPESWAGWYVKRLFPGIVHAATRRAAQREARRLGEGPVGPGGPPRA